MPRESDAAHKESVVAGCRVEWMSKHRFPHSNVPKVSANVNLKVNSNLFQHASESDKV